MSLACLECHEIGSFNTLVVFDPKGTFDGGKPVSSYRNFCTCCASFSDFSIAEESNFGIVREKQYQDRWNTGNDGPLLRDVEFKRVNSADVQRLLPKIFGALAQ